VAAVPPTPTPTPVFNPPTNLQASLISRTVSLSWMDNSNVETGYEVQISHLKGKNQNWSVWGVTGPDVTTLVGSLGRGTYSFRVRGKMGNPVTYTTLSNEVTVTIR